MEDGISSPATAMPTQTDTHMLISNEKNALLQQAHSHTPCNENPASHAHQGEGQVVDVNGLIQQAVDFLETKQEVSLVKGSYVHFDKATIDNMPMYDLTVGGKRISFIVDSGATVSVIRHSDCPNLKFSGRHMYTLSASGEIVKEQFTKPVSCSDGGSHTKHSFLLSSHCPINLLARDLMRTLGISLISTGEGIQVVKTADLFLYTSSPSPPADLFVYQWKLTDLQIASSILGAAHDFVTDKTSDFMHDADLHCTVHTSLGPDDEFSHTWGASEIDFLHLTYIYWNATHAFVSVALTQTQHKLFSNNMSTPHIPLAKQMGEEWEGMGEPLLECVNATDWQDSLGSSQPSQQQYSASTQGQPQ